MGEAVLTLVRFDGVEDAQHNSVNMVFVDHRSPHDPGRPRAFVYTFRKSLLLSKPRDVTYRQCKSLHILAGCLSILVILLVGLIAGWLAGQIVKGTGYGLVADICIGIIGALIGSWLLPQLGIHLGAGIVSSIIVATIGAIILLVILRLVNRGGRW